MKLFKNPRGLSPTVLKLGVVSFIGDIASEMLYPVTPIFLTTVLGAPMAFVGLIEGFAEAVASVLKIYAGVLSDKYRKRKPFIFAGYLLSALSRPLIGAATSWSYVLIARASDRFGKGIRTAPRDALLSDSVTTLDRGIAFGWHRAMNTFGAALGPLLALWLLDIFQDDLRKIYMWALVPGLLSAFLVLLIKDKSPSTHVPTVKVGAFKNMLKNKAIRRYLLGWGIFYLTSFSDVFLIMKMKESGITLAKTILIYCFYNIFYASLSPYLGYLSDRLGRKKVLTSGLLLFSLVYIGFGYATEEIHYWFLFIFYGVYMAATEGVSKAYMVDLSPASLEATALGLFTTVTGIGSLVAGLTCGLIWDNFGSLACFLYGASGALVGALILSRGKNAKYLAH